MKWPQLGSTTCSSTAHLEWQDHAGGARSGLLADLDVRGALEVSAVHSIPLNRMQKAHSDVELGRIGKKIRERGFTGPALRQVLRNYPHWDVQQLRGCSSLKSCDAIDESGVDSDACRTAGARRVQSLVRSATVS